MRLAAILIAVAACTGEPATSSESQELGSIVTNGSFETGDYTGWTLGGAQPTTWGIAQDGQVIPAGGQIFDFFHQVETFQSSVGLPITYASTDGELVAVQLQNGPGDNRMFQTVTLPACQPLVLWDMAYNNHFSGFDSRFQFIAVHVRDPGTDAVLATVFETTPGQPLAVPMSPFQGDLSAFSGQTVRLDFEQQVQSFYFDAAYDNIRIICKGLSASPGTVDFGAVPIATTSAPKPIAITNFAPIPLTIASTTIDGPFTLSTGLAVPLVLAPGDETSVAVTFAPLATGAQSGTLTIASDDPNGPTVVELTGAGTTAAHLDVVTALAFPDVQVGDSASLELTLSNTGLSPLTISAASIPAPFALVATLPVTLAPNDSVTITVTFSPDVAGPAAASLELDSDDPDSPTLVAVSGNGDAPALTLSTATLSFGTQHVGTTSAGQIVRATNTGVGAVTISAADAAPPFAVAGSQPVTIAAGDFADFTVTFAPSAEGPAAGQLVLSGTAGASTVALDGAGIAPHIAVVPVSIDFGNQHVGTTGSQAVVVTNTGSDLLTVSALGTAPPFATTATPFTLAPNASATVPVTFTPASEGPFLSTLSFLSDDAATPLLGVPLRGAGVIGKVTIVPGAVSFASQRVGTTSSPLIVTVTNSGTDTLTISSVGLGGPFAMVALGASVLAPNASTQYAITFSPVVAGLATTSLAIVSDAPSSPDLAPVSGTGVEPLATVTPATLAFGNQRVGTTSAAKLVTLSNPGSATLTVSSIAASGPFTATAATPFTIAPGQSATIGVAFAPIAAGGATGNLTITSDATTTPSVALAGTGVEPVIQLSATVLAFGNQRVLTASAGQAVTVTNTGGAPLSIASATAFSGFVATAPSGFPIGVLPGGHATFTVKFAPNNVGAAVGNLTITSDAASSPTVVTLTGTGVLPLLSVSPPSFDFGDVAVAATSAPATFTIANSGTDAFTITSVAVAAPFAAAALALPATIAPGGSVSFTVTFAPTTRAPASTVIAIASDVGFTSIPLTGRGVAPLVAASPSAVAFGTVPIPTTSQLALQLSNPGNAALSITALTIAGANAAEFSLANPPGLPATIPAGGSLALVVAFQPGDHGTRTAQLVTTSNAPSLVTQLSGKGVGPRGQVSPSALVFAPSNVTVAAPPRSVTVSNTGELALVVTSIGFSGANPSDFATTAALPMTIAAGASANLAFTFTPTAIGARTAIATVTTTDPLAPSAAVTLAGVGQSPMIAVAPASLAFGGVRIGQSATLPLALANTGSGPLTISSIALAGPDAATLTIAATALPLVIAPATSHTLQITFAPAVLASATATLTVLSDDLGAASVVIPIGGTGVSPTVAVDPSALDFGGQLVGHTSAARDIHIQNTGSGGLAVTALALTGPFALTSPPLLPRVIPGNGELVLTVTFAPTAIAAHAGDLQITTDSPDAPDAVVHLSGLGLSTALAASPSSIDFGTIHAATASAPMPIALANMTSDPITLTDGVFGGGLPGDFTVTTVAGVLAPLATIAATVTYAPATAEVSAATLTIGATDPALPEVIIALTGKAVSAFLTADHMAVDFGAIELGDQTGAKPIAITNTTTAPLVIQSIVASDPQFVVDATLAPIAPGASTSFTVLFAPRTEGAVTAGVAITLVGAATPELTVTVTGDGTARPNEGGCAAGGGAGWPLIGLLALLLRRRATRGTRAA